LPGLTRSEFLVRAGGSVTGATVLGLFGAPAWGAPRFPSASEFDAEVATAWFDQSLALVQVAAGFSPPVASRMFGYAGIALYQALQPGMDGFRSLAGVLPGLGTPPAAGRNGAYDWPTVANAALASVLRGLFPPAQSSAVDALESRLEGRLRPGLPRGVFARSLERGRAVAAHVLEWSKGDGGHEGHLRNFPPYEPPSGPGLWVPTPPGFLSAQLPSWGLNRCLAIAGGADCAPGDHPPYSEDPASAFYAEGLEVYDAVQNLTPEQEEIARFWSDNPGQTATPPGHSISITTQVLRREDASLAAAAEAYARVGMAVCDAFIACWHQKYAYNLLRPVTYIQRLLDPGWQALLVTPPFPEYPSGHSVQSGAAFQALTDLFGEDYAFVDHTHDERGFIPRSFGSFFEAAEEAAISRLYGGIHFRAAIDNGVDQGKCIGEAVSALPFRA
ncbi:MAG: vanadium-dependent haloperoxidase, partial [Gaiellaceae bacterium]